MESLRRGASGMDAARGLGVPPMKGHGWPLRGDPRSSDGMREVSSEANRGRLVRMEGQDLLVPFGGAAIRATAKKDSPSRAKLAPRIARKRAAARTATSHLPHPRVRPSVTE